MALFLRQDDQRSELQKRVAAELQEKLKNDKPLEYEKPSNSLEDNTHVTRHLATWLTLTAMIIITVVFVVAVLN